MKNSFIIRFAEVDGMPVENQLRQPLVIINPDLLYKIASIQYKDVIFPILVKVENDTTISIRFEVKEDCINMLFTIPENGHFFGIIPIPNIQDNFEKYWIKLDIKDENAALKRIIFVIYKK